MRENQTCTIIEGAEAEDLAVARTASFTGAWHDIKDCGSVELAALVGALTAASAGNSMALGLEHADESDQSDAATVDLKDTVVNGTPGWADDAAAVVINDAGQANSVQRISYTPRAKRRYVRLIGTETGTFDGVIGVVVVKSHLAKSPA